MATRAAFGASFSIDASSSSSPSSSSPFASSRAASARALFALGDDFGDDAARELAATLALLRDAGFHKAAASAYSVFDRILGGVAWLLQRLVRREQAARTRVQWELLFQRHDKMKPRLGLAQDVVARLDALPFAPPHRLQPHQLLLQDFGDIGAVRRLVAWLVELLRSEELNHLEAIRAKRAYLDVVADSPTPTPEEPLKREVVYLQRAYQPRRRYQYTSMTGGQDESEDALIQKCLLEYGERVAAATVVEADFTSQEQAPTVSVATGDGSGADVRKSLMAQLAVAASAASASRRVDGASLSSGVATKQRTKSKDTRDFEAQYQRIAQQALAEETALLERQRVREAELLRQVVSVPDTSAVDADSEVNAFETSAEVKAEQTKLHDHQVRLATLEDTERRLREQREQLEAEQFMIEGAMKEMQEEQRQLEAEEHANGGARSYLPKLRSLVSKNEALKRQKNEFKAKCKTELEALQARVAQLREQSEHEAAQQDEETLRLNEIEQMHTQLATKPQDLRTALARQTRELQKRMKQIDDVPTRIELVQYEKRFLELYDEVALTLDETRKYYSVYNTLKTTHEFLEKEISLINSMHDNFDVAMGSKPATQAFFSQLDSIIQNVETSVRKQQTLRADHQVRVETLDSKYQLLLEKERMYVNAIREFQKECEKNEKLGVKLSQYQRRAQPTAAEDLVTTKESPLEALSEDIVL